VGAAETRLQELIQERTGIEASLETPAFSAFLASRVKALGLAGPHAYAERLVTRPRQDPEWALVIEAVTNGLTHFFRDLDQFDALGHMLAQLRRSSPGRTLQLWSAGCATGEEPYSLAMHCDRLGIPARVLGTDVNRLALDRAARADYRAWSLRHVDAELRARYFEQVQGGDEAQPRFAVRPSIRARVRFELYNLVTEPTPRPDDGAPGWDAIFCRNVLIYYARETVERIARKLVRSLSPEGALFLGASESLRGLDIPLHIDTLMGRALVRPWRGAPQPSPARSTPAQVVSPPVIKEPAAPPPVEPAPSASALEDAGVGAAGTTAPTSFLEARDELIGCVAENDLAGAAQLMRQVTERSERDALAWLSRGHLALVEHRFDQAERCYLRVATLDPLLAEVHFFLGLLEHKRARFDSASAHLQKALFLEPEFWAAAFLLGSCAQRLGQEETRRREYRRVAELIRARRLDLPLVSQPSLHARFIPAPDQVLRLCEKES